MTNPVEPLMSANKASFQVLEHLTLQAYALFEKIVRLNMATSKALFGETCTHTQALISAKDPQEVVTLQSGLIKTMTERSAIYAHDFYDLASKTSAKLTRVMEDELAETRTAFSESFENLVKNAPAGADMFLAPRDLATQNLIE